MTADDQLAVAQTIYRYAVGIDTRDFALYRSIFADEVTIDFTSYSAGVASVMPATSGWPTCARSSSGSPPRSTR